MKGDSAAVREARAEVRAALKELRPITGRLQRLARLLKAAARTAEPVAVLEDGHRYTVEGWMGGTIGEDARSLRKVIRLLQLELTDEARQGIAEAVAQDREAKAVTP